MWRYRAKDQKEAGHGLFLMDKPTTPTPNSPPPTSTSQLNFQQSWPKKGVRLSDSKKFADEKEDERKAHDKAMEDTLTAYEKDINSYLKKLRAGFTIVELKGQHSGGKEPRTTYAIQLRGKTVKALQRDEDPTGPCVPYALSEGDKRSLALAFFLARLKTDAQKQQRVLVFDDPVTSLDENRRKETVSELVELAQACDQLFVLSHDPYFLRQVRDAVGASQK